LEHLLWLILRSTGFLATTAAEYAEAMARVLSMPPQSRTALAINARLKAQTFDDASFETRFVDAVRGLMA
jgi:hypothetical protein